MKEGLHYKLNKVAEHFKPRFEIEVDEYLGPRLICKTDSDASNLLHMLQYHPYNCKNLSIIEEIYDEHYSGIFVRYHVVMDMEALDNLINVIDNKLTGRNNFLKNINKYIASQENAAAETLLNRNTPENGEVFYELRFKDGTGEIRIQRFLSDLARYGVKKEMGNGGIEITKFDIGRLDYECHKIEMIQFYSQHLEQLDEFVRSIVNGGQGGDFYRSFAKLLASSSITQDDGKVVIENNIGSEELFQILNTIANKVKDLEGKNVTGF